MPIVTKEDAILSKLIWISKGSNKSRHDVKTMLRRSGEIDSICLNSQASELGVRGIVASQPIYQNRATISSQLLAELALAAAPWGSKILRCEIKNINRESDITMAMEIQMRADRQKRK